MTVDGNDLKQLRIFRNPLELGAGRFADVIHFWATDRDDVNRAELPERRDTRGTVHELRTGIGVVMSLQHQVDFELVKNGLPCVANLFVVPIFCTRIDWMMKRDDRPANRGIARSQNIFQPGDLFRNSFVRI